jgi:hypothetical protein
MTPVVKGLALAEAHEITDTSVIRIGPTDYPVTSLYVTPSGARVVQLINEACPRVFLANDIVTLVDPTAITTVPDARTA